ncbi:hypothetical protein NX80_008190 [Xanthomonas vasicola pv. arecae]|uniref:DUF7696 family protein n=1 Tax=Xanthomonas vasicola TaxID=56459 RepID=UPI00052D38D8|nr:hypothetical protein [Xanthomonas vasicola]AZR26475.1 hypothetical protein NX80_008190 [Xanthomonas vasicola pv. arecae]AZR35763.1 hypothetical protein NX08_016230 [Xanthomonas vasicola]KGR51220.1 hypothetical protein NX07_14400 [Xanthomonas vasicola]KGR57721.1 hypothetical protein NX09_02995 [Xanthomonas vasicola]KGT83141.1 hypothetical protein OC00_15380 [Xanthomonas vasicola]
MSDEDTEVHRRQCEAPYWLRQGYTDAKSVGLLQQLIAAKRGDQAAKDLREEMREQWRNRQQWQQEQLL